MFTITFTIFSIVITLFSVVIFMLSLLLFSEYLAFNLGTGKNSFKESLNSKPYNRNTLKVAVLVPAHNEEACIESTLTSIQASLMPQDELVVVADNCSDRTVEIVSSLGVCVLERESVSEIGKGYALDFGLQYLELNAPDIVIFVDADCQVTSTTIEYLAKAAAITQRPVQSLYLFKMPEHQALKQQIIVFATKIRNYMRPLGVSRLGMPGLLLGSGMAFPWLVIKSVDIATPNLVEDIKLGLDLAISGYSPTFCPEAIVTSFLPSHGDAAASQKNRWEQGHLSLIRNYFPLLVKESVKQKNIDLALLAWDLAIPPMALFVFMWLSTTVISIGVFWVQGWVFPFFTSALSGFLLVVSVLGTWLQLGRHDLPVCSLLKVPFYLLWKVSIYFKIIIRPQTEWVRTQRD